MADGRQIQGSWLEEYLNYTRKQESPTIFHRWCGLSVVASAMERNVVLDMEAYRLFPNLYVVLVADSGRCKKTTAMDLGYGVLARMDDKINIFAQKITPEALIGRLASRLKLKGEEIVQDCTSTVFATELSVFLGKDAYASGLISILTELYQGRDQWAYETKKRGEELLFNTLINMIGAITPSGLRLGIPKDATGAGFTSRIVFIYASKPRSRIAFPKVGKMKRAVLIHDLNHMRTLEGEFGWDEGTRDWYKKWYDGLETKEPIEALAGYQFRRQDMLLKVAMLLSLCEGDTLKISIDNLKTSLKYNDEAYATMGKAIKAMEETSEGADTNKVYEYILKNKEVDRSVLLRSFSHRLRAKQLNEILDTLTGAQVIGTKDVPTKPGARGKREKQVYYIMREI